LRQYLIKHNATKTWGSGGKVPHSVDLGTSWRSMVSLICW